MQSTASVHIFDMSKAVITCQSATQLIASLHICHMSKPVITLLLMNFCRWAFICWILTFLLFFALWRPFILGFLGPELL